MIPSVRSAVCAGPVCRYLGGAEVSPLRAPCESIGPLLLRALINVDNAALKPDIGINGLSRLWFQIAQDHL